jgi:putative ATP-dependent endonuclease of OLD family
MTAPTILQLAIERFRRVRALTWLPAKGANIILGGGDAGKTTILDAVALLLAPTNAATLSDADYHGRNLAEGFRIEAVMSLPPERIGQTLKPSWPWEWKDSRAVVPAIGEEGPVGASVYVLRVSGTPELELLYEIVQPNGDTDHLPVGLRRAIGIIRLSGDDRNDRDLRLVQGSALERLLSDRGLRSRLGNKLAEANVKAELQEDAKRALADLDEAFKEKALPDGLDLAVTGAQGITIAALIGLTARKGDVQLPLSNWGSGTRRLAALAIAEQNQHDFSITLVDEVERGLEPYRQRTLIEKLQRAPSQAFITTHSASAISAATASALWYLDHAGAIGRLDGAKIAAHQVRDPDAFLSRLTIVVEGATEVGFLTALLQMTLGGSLQTHGITVSDAGGHDTTIGLLEALSRGGLKFGGLADNEGGLYPERWGRIQDRLGPLLFRWQNGCLEENFISAVPAERIEELIAHPEDGPGNRLRTLAVRLDIEDKAIGAIRAAAGERLVALIIEAATGAVPAGKEEEKKTYKNHAGTWFKSIEGGQEIAAKMFAMGLWPQFRPRLMPFLNAIRAAIALPQIEDLPQ